MISFDNVEKSYGLRNLFSGVTFNVNAKERIGLVGRNGDGKTTLMRVITGEEAYDDGKLTIPKNYKIGYLNQHIAFSKKKVIDEAMLGLSEDEANDQWKAEKILTGLGFSKEDMEKSPHDFSGGYQVRLTLAKVLLSNPNMLLLDEPTNYLDIVSIRWLKGFLATWQGELMLITHDRMFMDDIITHTVGIHRKKVRKIQGDTSKFYEQIAKDEEIYEKTRQNDEQKRKEVELFISRFRAKARLAGLVQSRVKSLDKMKKLDKLEEIKNLEFTFRYKPFTSKQVMRADNLTFGYDKNNPLIKDFSMIIGSEDRIAIIGKNGKGKSTLMKLLHGTLTADVGSIQHHNGSKLGYFEQTNVSSLVGTRTVEEEVQSVSENLDRTLVRNICGAMLFRQDDALKKISVLSGGEKARVMLGKLLATPMNLIMLDEPTNHLDMDSCDGLVDALDNFEGAILMITHNEIFLNALATRLIVFQDDEVFVFDGNYAEFLEKIGWSDEDKSKQGSAKTKVNKKDLRKQRGESIAERNKILKPLQEKIDSLEVSIHNNEEKIKELNVETLSLATNGDGLKLVEVSKDIALINKIINDQFDELDGLTRLLEEKKALFDVD